MFENLCDLKNFLLKNLEIRQYDFIYYINKFHFNQYLFILYSDFPLNKVDFLTKNNSLSELSKCSEENSLFCSVDIDSSVKSWSI